MYNTQNNALAEQKFMLPAAIPEGEFTQEELAEDMDGLQMSFPRIKIPGGGSLQFEIPSDEPENPDYAKTLEGVILFNHPNNAYWPEGNEYDDSTAPLCSSVDAKQRFLYFLRPEPVRFSRRRGRKSLQEHACALPAPQR